ncbi:glycosyltransferase [Rhodanobacter hydrolyticus]
MVRNACQYEHFAAPPAHVFRDKQGRKVIGYYGAIAEWFDLDLLEKVAQRHADCLVLVVGADTAGAQQRVRHLANVEFTGEVPYAELPYYLHGFDVCLLPFQVIPLTLATNPVKVYEYLSAGKEVVSIALPEISQFGDLVRAGDDHAAFLAAVDEALRVTPDPEITARRQRFSAEQTWAHRAHDLMRGIDALPEARVSVIVVTYNNLDLTKACLSSLEQYSDYTNLEVIVVDNASSDGTPDYLAAWAAAGKDRRLILNLDNRGFAAANNQGLAVADGDYLVLLNNDTHVTPGWIATLVAHLGRTKGLGMIGPVTNNIGNEARIEISYDDMDGMLHAAADYTTRHAGLLTPLRTAAFFCVMVPRAVYEKVGPLDEAFGIGFFEDDDYCRRVEQAGWGIACADDVFVHHHLSASFNKLKLEQRQTLFERNKAIYEAKWGAWSPHKYRDRQAS